MTFFHNIITKKLVWFAGLGILILLSAEPSFAQETQVLSAGEITQRAQSYMQNHMSLDPDTMDVDVVYEGEDLVLPKGELDLDFQASGNGERGGRVPLALQIKVDKKFQRRLRLMAMVTISQDVVKARRPVSRGELISADDVELVMVKSNRAYKNAAVRLQDVVGLEASRSLKTGRVVKMDAVQKPALVGKGDQVTLVVQNGPMKITAPGISVESGTLDSLVQIKNLQSKKMVYGRVIGPNMVEVNY